MHRFLHAKIYIYATYAKESLGMPGYARPHPSKFPLSICSFNGYLFTTKIKLALSVVFEILKFLKSCNLIGREPNHTHLNLYHYFVALMDMYLHAKNQSYTFNSF